MQPLVQRFKMAPMTMRMGLARAIWRIAKRARTSARSVAMQRHRQQTRAATAQAVQIGAATTQAVQIGAATAQRV